MTTTEAFNLSALTHSVENNFETAGHSNGRRFWYASDLMAMLGYETLSPLQKPIDKAIATCKALEIPVEEHFAPETRLINQATVKDYRLSRFACYLTTMNGDGRRPQVAAAQAYFATVAESFLQFCEDPVAVERVLIREELSNHERIMSGMAKQAGASDYRLFQNAGYRGMYNMDLRRLKEVKRVDGGRSLLDFMTKLELAANLFRITQTEARIRNGPIQGQKNLEAIAEQVGRTVRNTMIEISGDRPEDLRVSEDLRLVRSNLRKTNREFDRLDTSSRDGLPYKGPLEKQYDLHGRDRHTNWDNRRRAS